MNKQERTPKQVAQNLKDAYTRIGDPDKRSTFDYARNADGQKVSPFSENAATFCSVGTLIRTLVGVQEHTTFKAAKKACSKAVNSTLQSPEYEALAYASCEAGFHGVTDMHDRAKEDVFHNVWLTAILVAEAA